MLCRCVRTVLVESDELVRDLLVDHALGEALEDLELARRRAGTARPRAGGRVRRVGQVVEDRAQLARAEADGAGGSQQLGRARPASPASSGRACRRGGRRRRRPGVVGVVALDRRGDGLRQVPAAGEHAADQRVVDAELAALVVQALLGRARGAVDLLRVARVGVHEHELADVVQQRGDQQAVAVRVAGLGGEAVGGALDGDGVQAEALGRGVPTSCRARRTRRSRRGRRAAGRPRARAPRRR